MTNKSFDQLMAGYINNRLTANELQEFLQLVQQEKYAHIMQEQIQQMLGNDAGSSLLSETKRQEIFQALIKQARKDNCVDASTVVPLKEKRSRFTFLKYAAAAAFIGLMLSAGIGWFNQPMKKPLANAGTTETKNPDIPPGTNKAVLTLADGSIIMLDDTRDGNIARQGNTTLIKIDGKINYNAAGTATGEALYNTISTPRGGQYQVALPDGSQVWLNAASSLRFPTSFSGKERRVEIKGQAYFEIARNASMPFFVKVKDAEIQVVGTHFDVMAYADETAVKTTLLEGVVKFLSNNVTSQLKPGQQSLLLSNGDLKLLDNIDMDNVIAWKNGNFHFQGDDIRTVMRQLSRWYEVEVEYREQVSELFYAEIPRDTKLSDVLRLLELTGKVRFNINGKTIVVSP